MRTSKKSRPLPTTTLEFDCGLCTELPVAKRELAIRLLVDRFGKRKENVQIVKRLFGEADGNQHCYYSKRGFERSEMKRYQCAVAMVAGKCVAAACFRHVSAPRRAPADRSFTELLLLAVAADQERQGYGGAMFQFVVRASASSENLLVSHC